MLQQQTVAKPETETMAAQKKPKTLGNVTPPVAVGYDWGNKGQQRTKHRDDPQKAKNLYTPICFWEEAANDYRLEQAWERKSKDFGAGQDCAG